MAFDTMFLVGDRPLVFAPRVALMAVSAIEHSWNLPCAQVEFMIEFQRIFIADPITYLPELRMIDIKRSDDFSIAFCRTLA